MKVSKRQLRRIIKEERARVLSEQPISGEQAVQMQSDEEKKKMESEAEHFQSGFYDATWDLVSSNMYETISSFEGEDVHPLIYKAAIAALKGVAADLEMEMKDIHPPEFITLWEPGYGPGGG